MLKLCRFAIFTTASLWLLNPAATFAGSNATKTARFEFANYEAEGVFSMYRLDVNLETRQVSFCFLSSNAVGREMPDDLPDMVCRGGSWRGHFDFDHAKGKMCFDSELAVGRTWFSSIKPVRYVDDNDYQFFFIGEIKRESNKPPTYSLDGKLNIFVRHDNMDLGMREYASEIVLHEKNVAPPNRPTVPSNRPTHNP